jgi:hypothetical protein
METKTMEPLLERAGEYGKVSYELIRLRTINKIADMGSTMLPRFLFFCCMLVFALFVTLGASLWLGKLLGENYLGFLVIALFYGLIGMMLYLRRCRIKEKAYNFLIKQILN